MLGILKGIASFAVLGLIAGLSYSPAQAEIAPAGKSMAEGATGTLVVNVVDKDGKPAAGVAVRVITPKAKAKQQAAENGEKKGERGHGQFGPSVAEGTTDAQGSVTLTVPAGTYGVIAFKRGEGMGHVRAEVTAGQTATVSITLEPHQGPARSEGNKSHKKGPEAKHEN